MARKKQVDSGKLIEAVDSEMAAKEIMKQFGIKTRLQLKALYYDALVETGRIKGVAGRPSKAAQRKDEAEECRINKRGSLIIPRAMIDEMGFDPGATFTIRKTKAGISLRKC